MGPGQKNLAVGEAILSPPDSVSTEDAAVEALNMSFGAGSYARRILESMGWKEVFAKFQVFHFQKWCCM